MASTTCKAQTIIGSKSSLRLSTPIQNPSYQIRMKTTIISLALSLLLPLSGAAPSSKPLSARQTDGVLFQGAAGASFVIDNVPQDNTIFNISTSTHTYPFPSYQSPINGPHLIFPPNRTNPYTIPGPPHDPKHTTNPRSLPQQPTLSRSLSSALPFPPYAYSTVSTVAPRSWSVMTGRMWPWGRPRRSYGALALLLAFRDSCVRGRRRVLNALLTCHREHERSLREVMGGVGVMVGGWRGVERGGCRMVMTRKSLGLSAEYRIPYVGAVRLRLA